MNRLVSKKYIWIYLVIFFVFKYTFSQITCFYIPSCSCTAYPIDVRTYQGHKYFDAEFVTTAKTTTYDHYRYYISFLPLDLLFPFFYTLLFLSCLEYCKNQKLYKVLFFLIIAGAVLDWSEDLSFAIYLSPHINGLALLVAVFTTIKTFVFITNILLAIVWMIVGLYRFIKGRA